MKANPTSTFLLCLALLTVSGCAATHAVLNKANVQDKTNDEGKVEETVEKPGWLVLVPFAVIADVVTGPVQVVVLLFTYREGH